MLFWILFIIGAIAVAFDTTEEDRMERIEELLERNSDDCEWEEA